MRALQGGYKPSAAPPITSTGMQGFLLWLQREQPEVYQKVAPKISASFPSVFSDYTQSVGQAIRARAGNLSLMRRLKMRGFSGLGDGGLMNGGAGGEATNVLDPTGEMSVTGMGYALNPDLTVNTGTLTGTGFDSIDATQALNEAAGSAANINIADAANTTAGTPTGTTSGIASIISGVTGLFTTVQQQQTANQITALQLQRAQAGLAPLNIGMAANGVPTITGLATSPTTLLIVGAALLGALFLFGGRRSAAA